MPHVTPPLQALNAFLETSLDSRLNRCRERSAEETLLGLFHSVVEEVPAYPRFLQSQGVEPDAVTTLESFRRLPPVTRGNYLSVYPLPDLCRRGRLAESEMIAVSSGSTGRPHFWPRSLAHEAEVATRFEQVFADTFSAADRTSLAIVCFTLGTWVGGMYTAHCCRLLSMKGYPITLVTPGNNKEEIFRCVNELGPLFDQVVLLGYPPFLKDVVDSGAARGVHWKDRPVRMVFAGEVFSEEWRSLVGSRVGALTPCFDSASLYGTADAGVLGNETPLSIGIRRFLAGEPELARDLFGEARLPTLVQYDPLSRWFEVENRSLLLSGEGGVPLIRYAIGDTGGLIPFARMIQRMASANFHPLDTIPARHRELPFVFVFGRSDFTVSFFGANIYPENVTVGLEQPPIPDWVSGKFVLEVLEGEDHNRHLSVSVEMLTGIESSGEKEEIIARSIRRQLERLNSEFAHYVPAEYRTPRVRLLPAGDPTDFPIGVKHRYTRPTTDPR